MRTSIVRSAMLWSLLISLLLLSACIPTPMPDYIPTACPERWTILRLHDNSWVLIKPGQLDDPECATQYNSADEAAKAFMEENDRRKRLENAI